MTNKISTQPYPGTRDFYPEDWALQQYIFDVWRQTCLKFGFEEYQTPLIENYDLYAVKSGAEVVDQLYNFEDKGGRRVALRPEMTPSVARLVAAKGKSLAKPLKWFSIASFYRCEKPQKGRLREFFQLNADIFGVEGVSADFEILQLNRAIMDNFVAQPKMYEVRVNNRKLMDYLYQEQVGISDQSLLSTLSRLIDKRDKIPPAEFTEGLQQLGLSPAQQQALSKILSYTLTSLKPLRSQCKGAAELLMLFELLKAVGIAEGIVFSPSTVRGFDYYDGIVFEQFDLNPQSKRSMFGGGRYDSLLNIFGLEPIAAQGFAQGDVTTAEFLRNWDLVPKNLSQTQAQILVTVFTTDDFDKSFCQSASLTQQLRQAGLRTELILENQNLGNQLEYANRKNIPYAVILGPEELANNQLTLKNMQTGQQESLKVEGVIDRIGA